MDEVLPLENLQVVDYQKKNANKFCDGLIKEADEANNLIIKLKEKIIEHHSQGPDKSFLKAPI